MWFFMTCSWLYPPDEWVTQVNISQMAKLLWEKILQPLKLFGFLHSLDPKETFTCHRNRVDRICPFDQPALDSRFTLNRIQANHARRRYGKECQWTPVLSDISAIGPRRRSSISWHRSTTRSSGRNWPLKVRHCLTTFNGNSKAT